MATTIQDLRKKALTRCAGFSAWLEKRHGRKWVVAPRLTDRLRSQGYDVAIPSRVMRALEIGFERATFGAPLLAIEAHGPELFAAARAVADDASTANLDALRRLLATIGTPIAIDSRLRA